MIPKLMDSSVLPIETPSSFILHFFQLVIRHVICAVSKTLEKKSKSEEREERSLLSWRPLFCCLIAPTFDRHPLSCWSRPYPYKPCTLRLYSKPGLFFYPQNFYSYYSIETTLSKVFNNLLITKYNHFL